MVITINIIPIISSPNIPRTTLIKLKSYMHLVALEINFKT